ncbi:hypothetical protein QJS04_geneDACA022341 [Acorus gramineus]|uniref:Reverse transcriptase n=1 Tax=Acorus gramineus TaxID=55184 RepID=A0AAV9AHW7_ACOGR|nr:hypothetical protein QJS04_geneDACA022341 [Acorus gramineus]
MSRLDRVLVNEDWLLLHPEALVFYHPPGLSDHSAMQLILVPSFPLGPMPFKFFNDWVKHDSFFPLVRSAWEVDLRGTTMFNLVCKLKRVKVALKAWSKEVLGPIQHCLAQQRCTLDRIQL